MAKNDSIKKYLELAGDVNLDFEKRKKYNEKAYSYIDLNKNDSLTRKNLYIIGVYNSNLLQFEMLNRNSRILYKLAFNSSNQLSIADAYKLKALNYMYKSENEKAVEFFYKSKKIYLKLNLINRQISINRDIAQVQLYSCDFLGSNKTLFENLELIKKTDKNFKEDLYRNYGIVAGNFSALKNYNNSILFEKKALDNAGDKLRYVNNCYLGIATCYIGLKKYDYADYYIKKILDNPNSKNVYPLNFYSAKSTFGYLKLIQNKVNGLPFLFIQVEDYLSKKDDDGGQDVNQVYLSEYYAKVGDTVKAIASANAALILSKSYRNPINILNSLNQLIKVDKKNASKNGQEYIWINDSLQISERRFRDKFAQIVYETNEITQEKEKAIKQKKVLAIILTFLILISMLLLIINRQRSKQQELQFMQSQQKANEEIYELMLAQKNKEELIRQSEKQRIALELHDGVMNRLASTRLNLNVLVRKNDEITIEKCLIHVEGIYQIEQEIRHIAHDLNQEVFNANNSFTALVKDFISTQNGTTSTYYHLEIDKSINWISVSTSIKMNLYRITQEACNNINKFAQADNAIISFILDNGNICLSISDDGKGFDAKKDFEGIGLKNIKLRVSNLNGKVVIQSNNKITSLNIAIPIH